MSLYPEHPILLVDDEPGWTHTMALSLRVSAGINNISVCNDSRDVLDCLRQKNQSGVVGSDHALYRGRGRSGHDQAGLSRCSGCRYQRYESD